MTQYLDELVTQWLKTFLGFQVLSAKRARGRRGGNQDGTSIKLVPLSLFIPFAHGFASILLFEACPLYRFKV
jgi:hypothetical protein